MACASARTVRIERPDDQYHVTFVRPDEGVALIKVYPRGPRTMLSGVVAADIVPWMKDGRLPTEK